MEFGPVIKNPVLDINKLVRQGTLLNQSVQNVEGDSTADQATVDLLANKDPVIHEVSVGMSGEEASLYTVSGTPPLSLPNSLGKPLKAWSVDLLPYQEGTGDPAPDNVRPIHGTNKLTIYTQETLADGYIQLEYAESNSTQQYVVTDVVPFAGMGFSCTYYVNNFVGTNDYGCIFGARVSSNVDDFQLTTYTDNPEARQGTLRWGADNQYSAKITRHVKQTTSLINGVLTLPDGSTTAVTAPSSFPTQSIVLHGLNNGTSEVTQFCRCRIYDLIIYNGDVVYRHFVPCRRTSDNTVGYYETETQTFLVPRGGNLTAGNPVGSFSVLTLSQTVYTGTIGSEGGESRWGEVDLGTLLWNDVNPEWHIFRTEIIDIKQPGATDYPARAQGLMCEQYKPDWQYGVNANMHNCTMLKVATSLYIRNDDYSSALDFKTALSGVKLVYETATTTTFAVPSVTIPTPSGTATTWATAEDGIVDSMEVTYVGKA